MRKAKSERLRKLRRQPDGHRAKTSDSKCYSGGGMR